MSVIPLVPWILLVRDTRPEPEDWGAPLASDAYWMNKARVITDAHTFIVPALWFGAAIFFWLGMRFLFAPSARHLRRQFGRWIAGDKPNDP